MNEITNHAELTVEKKKEGKYLAQRVLMMLSYFVFPMLLVVILCLINDDFLYASIFFIPIWAFLCPKLIKPITFMYVDIEEKMDVSGGDLTLSRIYGKRKTVQYIKVKVSELDAIVPYRDEYKEQIRAFKADRVIECVSSMKHPDIYCAYYTNDKGQKVLMYFEAIEKSLKVLKFLNSATVVVPVSR